MTTTRFGYGFEKESTHSPSTQHAQGFFLKLLAQLRKEVLTSLFDIAYTPFLQFLTNHRDEIHSIKTNIEPSLFPLDTAIRIFTGSWWALVGGKPAVQLCSALQEWADRWNLSEGWCLNHAVISLREQVITAIDVGGTNAAGTYAGWHNALFCGLETEGLFSQSEVKEAFRQEALHEFTFRSQIVVEGPFFKSIPEFKREVQQRFDDAGGATRGERKALQYELDLYLIKVEEKRKALNLRNPSVHWAADDHFRWLINYQIPPCMNYRRIARTVAKNEKTIREGIHSAANLIGLRLRPSDSDKYLGRPKGAKDKVPRRRVDRRREKCGEMQINIS